MRRVSALIGKELKKLVREPAVLFLVLLFPLMITLVFGISFGAVGGDDTTYQVGIVDENIGPYAVWSQRFVQNLTTTEILELHDYEDNNSAQDELSVGNLQAVVVIPADFGESCDSFITYPTNQSQWVNTTITLYLDQGSMIATAAVPPIVQQALVRTLAGEQASMSLPVGIGSPSFVDAERKTIFSYMAPGIFAFGAIFIIMIVAESLAGEREAGLLKRMSTTPISATEFMTAQGIAYMIMAILQVAVIFLMAFAIGYSPDASVGAMAMAFLIVTIFALCCVGFGLITTSIAKTTGGATGIAFLFIIPQMFLGTFVSAGMTSGAGVAAGKFMPSYYVTDALTSLFLRGASVSSPAVLEDLAIVSVASVVIFLVGIVIFRKFGRG